MSSRVCSWIILALAWVVLVFSAPALHATEVRDALAQMVRLMGYGAGIHDFKNYVLRGREEYRIRAHENFVRILEVIAGLERSGELTGTDQEALKPLKSVVESYDTALDRVTELRKKGWRIEDIDRAVVVDDTAAVQGLAALRTGRTWTPLEEIEFHLGYGKAIHNFKNYVIRGHESYGAEALEDFFAVDSLIADQLGGQSEIAKPQAVALNNIRGVVQAYRDNLALVAGLIARQRSVRQIDLAVKVNDTPAEMGLARLRQRPAHDAARRSNP